MSYYAPPPPPSGGGNFPPASNAAAILAMTTAAVAQNSQQDKINRELFIGNTPGGTDNLLLLHFLNAAMRRVGLCGPQETPVLNVRVNNKFSFAEFLTADLANKALSLNGIPFLGGTLLKVSRPSKYMGPAIPAQTWQQLTGQSVPEGAVLDADQEKIRRELFVGNTTPEMDGTCVYIRLNG